MAIGWLRSLLDFLGAGNLVLAIIGLLVTPFVDRLLIRRKRLSFRVLYNSKIGLDTGHLHDEDEPARHGQQLHRLAQLLDQLSIVVIRIRNNGSYDIDPEDFEKPLSFTFGRRAVWNARISEAGSPEERERLRSTLRFFRNSTEPDGQVERDNLRTVRDRLVQRMGRFVGGTGTLPARDPSEPTWHGVRMDRLSLRRRQKFKLVVVLREPEGGGGARAGETTKDYGYGGKLRENGLIKRESEDRHLTLQQITGGLAALLTVLLVLALVFAPTPTDPSLRCGTGSLRVVGSSVFAPTMRALAEDYMNRCREARLTAESTGSITGVREVAALDPDQAGGVVAMADGKQPIAQNGMYAQQLAVVVYDVVVNKSAGVTALSTDRLQGIFDGTYTDWSQLRGGAHLPIRIVSRGSNSGTRELFERNVLHGPEGELTSNTCLGPDRDPNAKVIRCERDSNPELIRTITETEGTIGYADAASVAVARRTGNVSAVVIDGQVFDSATGVDSGYTFWTVEYLYSRTRPADGTLVASFLDYLHRHDRARVLLKEAGYLPCTTSDGTPLELCNHR